MGFGFRQNFNFLKVFCGIKAPIYVQFALSKSCNMQCRMCNVVASRKEEEELGLEELKNLAYVLKKMGVGLLILSGGEPMLRPDIVEVVKIFAQEGISVRIQSNGLLFKKVTLEALKNAGLEGITISLHSLQREKMAYLTNIPDALNRIFHSLCLYSEVFRVGRHIGGINTVVSSVNIEEIPQIVEFVTRIGFTVSLIPVHLAQEEGFIVRRQDKSLFFPENLNHLLDKIYDRLIIMKRQGYNIYNSERFLRESPAFLKNGIATWKCESPDLYFSISTSGIFLPCVDLQGEYSMLEPNFFALWKKKDFKKEICQYILSCKKCMYACYPEFSYMFYSKSHFIRRIFEYRKMVATQRNTIPLTLEKINNIIKELKVEQNQKKI